MTSPSVAVVGAGVAGSACAAGLRRAGADVTVFDKSRSVGGRLASRQVRWTEDDGDLRCATFDHGARDFSAAHPRFRALMARAEAAGCVARREPLVHAPWPTSRHRSSCVPQPDMPALCRHWLAGVPLHLDRSVQRLQRGATGWQLVLLDGTATGPFDHVMIALPAPQAALLLAGHHDGWADELAAVRMESCWTLMAVTDDVDWPWDTAEFATGPLARVSRNDRQPGRAATPGRALWTAEAGAIWSAVHRDAEPGLVAEALAGELKKLMPATPTARWHHRSAHRWRYARLAAGEALDDDCHWDANLRLGVCGDAFGGSTVEAAWRSGDELADTVAAGLDIERGDAALPSREGASFATQ